MESEQRVGWNSRRLCLGALLSTPHVGAALEQCVVGPPRCSNSERRNHLRVGSALWLPELSERSVRVQLWSS